MNEDIVKEFVHFYYKCLNEHTLDLLKPHLKENSKYIRHDTVLNGTASILDGVTRDEICYTPLKYTILINGDRRANVLISGEINNHMKYTEYLLFSLSNKKEYWIHSSILHIIN